MADRYQERNWDPWERSEREAAFGETSRGFQGSRYPTFGYYPTPRFGSISANPFLFGQQPFTGTEPYSYGQFPGQGYAQFPPYTYPIAQTFSTPFGALYGNPYLHPQAAMQTALMPHPFFQQQSIPQPMIPQHPASLFMNPYLQSPAPFVPPVPLAQQPIAPPVIPGFAPQIPQTAATLPTPLPFLPQHLAQIYGQQFAQMQQPLLPYQLAQLEKINRYGQQIGQQWGQFSGRGPRGYRRPDERIKEDVIERLTNDPNIDASNVEVIVKDGEVTLRGVVEDREQKKWADEIVEYIFGIRDAQNQIRVEPPQWSQYQQTSGRSTEKEGELVGAGTRGKEK